MVKKYLLILKKISLTDASFASLSNDDFVKDETLVTSSLKIEEIKVIKVAKV